MQLHHLLTLLVSFAIACSSAKHREPAVFVLNGLDIPVTVSIESESGHAKLELPPHGRATPDVTGKATVKVTTVRGELISDDEAQFGKPGTPGCYRIYNVMGAAAYVNEDVAYGNGSGTTEYRRRAGEISEDECGISYAFVDPPDAIRVKQHSPSRQEISWLHYEGDGGWATAVNSLLDDNSRWASQSYGKAYMIVTAVVTHDPTNPALPAIKDRLTRMGIAIPAATPGNLLAQVTRRRR